VTTAPNPEDRPATERPKLTPEERRRRKARRAWIPTVVIGGIIVVAIAGAIAFQVSGLGRVTPPAAGDSKFNLAGIRVINGAADAQLDVRKPIKAASVGLPANSSKKFGPFNNIALEVDLVGIHGTASIFVDSMHIVTQNGYVTWVSTTTRNNGYSFIHSQLDSYSVLGVTSGQLAAFENAMPNGAGDPDSHFTLAVGDAEALGVPTHVTVSCAGAKGCTVSTITTLPKN
jgi:hypothetical protein